jgi:hypothetical protein
LALEPTNAVGTCLTVTSANILDEAPCNAADADQSFTFSGGGAAVVAATTTTPSASSTSFTAALVASTSDVAQAVSQCVSVTTVFVTRAAASSSSILSAAPPSSSAADVSSVSAAVQSSAAAVTGGEIVLATDAANPTTPVPVSGAGGTLQPSSAAEANQRDNTATRAFSSVSLKASNGQCLFIDPTAGDFRQNLIPVNLQPCDGSLNEKFDLITAGIHNNTPNTTLVVSSLVRSFYPREESRTNLEQTQGCISFDPRRAAGTTVQVFACGGRGDGTGQVANSQQFPYGGGLSLLLAPLNSNNQVCLIDNSAKNPPILDEGTCDGNADQLFSIVE